MSMTYTTETHPTAKGKILVRFAHPENWRCHTDMENMALCIGGTHYRRHGVPGERAYSVSPAQLRDMELLIDNGFKPHSVNTSYVDYSDQCCFWHYERDLEWLTRKEAVALCNVPVRCKRTLEMFPPIAEPEPVATLSGELEPPKLERVRTVSRVIGGMPYGHLQEEHFVVGLGVSFEWCEGPIDRWYSQREGRTSAYGPGYSTRDEAIQNIDAMIASESATGEPQDETATHVADNPEIVPQDEKNAVDADIETQPDTVAALIARMDALERRLESVSSVDTPSVEITNVVPLPIDPRALAVARARQEIAADTPIGGKRRSPAHVRAIMAYLQSRQQRDYRLDLISKLQSAEKYQAELMAERDEERKHNAMGAIQLDDMRAERDKLQRELNNARECGIIWSAKERQLKVKRRRAVLRARDLKRLLKAEYDFSDKKAAAHREKVESLQSQITTAETCVRAAENREATVKAELADLKRKLADPTNPVRESDLLMLRDNAQKWQAKAEAAIAESERLKRLAIQNGGHIENLAVRLAKAEAMLRANAPALTLSPPHAIAA